MGKQPVFIGIVVIKRVKKKGQDDIIIKIFLSEEYKEYHILFKEDPEKVLLEYRPQDYSILLKNVDKAILGLNSEEEQINTIGLKLGPIFKQLVD